MFVRRIGLNNVRLNVRALKNRRLNV